MKNPEEVIKLFLNIKSHTNRNKDFLLDKNGLKLKRGENVSYLLPY